MRIFMGRVGPTPETLQPRWLVEHYVERRVAGKLRRKRLKKRARLPVTWVPTDEIRMRGPW